MFVFFFSVSFMAPLSLIQLLRPAGYCVPVANPTQYGRHTHSSFKQTTAAHNDQSYHYGRLIWSARWLCGFILFYAHTDVCHHSLNMQRNRMCAFSRGCVCLGVYVCVCVCVSLCVCVCLCVQRPHCSNKWSRVWAREPEAMLVLKLSFTYRVNHSFTYRVNH